MKCFSAYKKITEIGSDLGKSDIVSLDVPTLPSIPSKFGHSLPMKFMFLE